MCHEELKVQRGVAED